MIVTEILTVLMLLQIAPAMLAPVNVRLDLKMVDTMTDAFLKLSATHAPATKNVLLQLGTVNVLEAPVNVSQEPFHQITRHVTCVKLAQVAQKTRIVITQ